MRLIKLALTLPLYLFSMNGLAMVSEVSGETSCSMVSLIEKQLIKQVPCSYTGSSGASMVYLVQQLDFKTVRGKNKTISTVNNSTFDFGEDGEMLNLVETILIDDEPAEVFKIDADTLKKLSPKQLGDFHEHPDPDYSKVLHCFKPIKKSIAFCIPYSAIYEMS